MAGEALIAAALVITGVYFLIYRQASERPSHHLISANLMINLTLRYLPLTASPQNLK
jgi:hypothetical protein